MVNKMIIKIDGTDKYRDEIVFNNVADNIYNDFNAEGYQDYLVEQLNFWYLSLKKGNYEFLTKYIVDIILKNLEDKIYKYNINSLEFKILSDFYDLIDYSKPILSMYAINKINHFTRQ
jgi:hypothetical protein